MAAVTRRRFGPEFRVGAVRIVKETGKPVAQVARDLGISPYTLHIWVQMDRLDEQCNGNGSGTLEESEREELARLRREKAALVKQHTAEKAAWQKERGDDAPTARQRRRADLDAEITRLFEASGGTYGSPRITRDLHEAGWRVTEIDTDQGKLYLATVEDLFSRRLLGYATSEHHDAALTCASLQVIIPHLPPCPDGRNSRTPRRSPHRGMTWADVIFGRCRSAESATQPPAAMSAATGRPCRIRSWAPPPATERDHGRPAAPLQPWGSRHGGVIQGRRSDSDPSAELPGLALLR
ncbi:transposase [Nonomuraea sp. ZG12]|uniref:transposase n=1 Tax=Nonomuraea sp. ZG12 TaxID=3452207 RepID=UPI003F88CE1A